MKRNALWMGLALVGGLALTITARLSAQAQDQFEIQQIRTATEQMRAAVQRGDAAGLSRMFTPDAEMVSANQTLQGRDQIHAHMAEILPLIADFRDEDREFFTGSGLAVETGRTVFTGKDGGTLAINRYMTLWKQVNGQWMIHRDVAVPVEQAAAARPQGTLSLEVRRRAEPQYAVVLPMTGSYRQHGEAIVKLAMCLEQAGLKPAGPAFGRYYNAPDVSTEQDLRWEVGFFVARRPDTALESPFQVWTLDPGEEAWAVVSGPHEGSRPWDQFLETVVQKGYRPVGEAMELWLEGPKTEMRISVQRNQR